MAATDRLGEIVEFRKLLEEETDLNFGDPADEKVLLRYLNSEGNDVEKAFKKLKVNAKLKAKYGEFFPHKRDPNLHDKILEKGIFQMLDNRDQLGRRIFLIRIRDLVYGEFQIHELIQTPDLFLYLALDEEETQNSGLVFLMDVDGMSWSLLRYISATRAMRVAAAKADNVPLRHMQIHVVNAGYVVTTAFRMILPFLSQRLKDLIYFHDDYDSLYKYISPSALPEEYGGERPPVDHERLNREFLDPGNDRLHELLSYGYKSYVDSEEEQEEEEDDEEEEEEEEDESD